jgi:hypothetical protein
MWVLRNICYGMAAFLLLVDGTADAASLNPETLKAWDAYVQSAAERMQQRLQPGQRFLSAEENEDRLASVRDGEPYIAPVGPQNPKKVPFGLIHDWVGAVFIPDTKIEDVLLTMRDYRRYKEFYHPGVVESKSLASDGFKDRFSVVLMNKVLVSKKALDSDCESSYVRVDNRHWYSISHTTRIQEVENYGSENQRKLPEDVGTGLIWRLSSITRFEERDGGVFVELEAIALSRDIPASLHWLVAPIVRRASRSSLFLSLEQTQNAIHPTTEAAKLPANADLFERGFRVLSQ